MEIIIFIAVVVVAALLWSGYVKTKKTESDQAIDSWQPPKAEDKPWPYGEKLAEGKIHVKVIDYADIAIAQIKTPPVAEVTAENKAEAVAKAKKPAVKKTAAKPAAAKKPAVKKTPAKKSST
jgi:hypothetical protein